MDNELIDRIRAALGRRGGAIDPRALRAVVRGLAPADIARILDELTLPEAQRVIHLLDSRTAAAVLACLEPARRGGLASAVPLDGDRVSGAAGADAAAIDRCTPGEVARLRLPWLLATMGIELAAGIIIARFDRVLRDVILLASFMPVISAVSGNVGLQAAAIVVRGLDTGHVSLHQWAEAIRRELVTALTIALVAGASLAAVAAAWSGHAPFAVVVGAAMTCAVVTAGFMGAVIPMVSKRLGFDPATTAGPFETAFQDLIGFTVFLWLASRFVRWLV